MKALTTRYKGYRFRSRTEARFAVFFDNLGVKWNYEVEGFDLDDGDLYLPDFFLPSLVCHVEIKGQPPTETEIRKCRKLQFHTGQDVAIFHGLPCENEGMKFGWSNSDGGRFVEESAIWTINDGLLDITNYPDEGHSMLRYAVRCAREARFDNSRPYQNIVDYDNLPF